MNGVTMTTFCNDSDMAEENDTAYSKKIVSVFVINKHDN